MTPAVVAQQTIRRPHVHNRVFDRVFFIVMILVLWATVLFGFAKTYFLAGIIRAPLPNLLIHVHGAAFSLWMILLLVQTTLVTTRNLKIHRALGMYGFGLAVLMIGLGVFAAVDAMNRQSGPLGLSPQTFFIIPVTDMLCFAILVFGSYRTRTRPELHKRLVLIATIALMDAAIARWPVALLQTHPPTRDLVVLAFLIVVAVFDLVSLHRVSKATIWGSLLLIVVHGTRVPIGMTHGWVAFANHLMKA